MGFELRLTGSRSVAAAWALLAEHGGDVAKLKEAEPWLFPNGKPDSSATGLKLTSAAADLALQGAAIAVCIAYMNQINDRLDGL